QDQLHRRVQSAHGQAAHRHREEDHGGRLGAEAHRHRRDDVHLGAGQGSAAYPQVLIRSADRRDDTPAYATVSSRPVGAETRLTTTHLNEEKASRMSQPAPVVDMTGISIAFPGVKALDGVDFRMFPGEVHSLMGENGAGKSTLIKALTGVYPVDTGRILLDGKPLSISSPAQAQAAGISTVYQEVNLLTNLTVAENIMLGREARRGPAIDWKKTRSQAAELLAGLSLDIDPNSLLSSHSLAVQQLVAIARAIGIQAKVLILDE